MLLIYNLLQILGLLLCLPCLALVVLLVPKYRGQTWRRLGFGLAGQVRGLPVGRPRIWVHALSLGEVNSARALLKGLRGAYPEAVLIFSASTTSGRLQAEAVIGPDADLIIAFPLDLYWVVARFLRLLAPDLFVLIETDLWPNFLAAIRRHQVAAVLLNGRISADSLANYRRFPDFFAELFNCFSFLAMQTGEEVANLTALGVQPEKLLVLGNLKYDPLFEKPAGEAVSECLAGLRPLLAGRTVWVAGSTHPGEEEAVLQTYSELRVQFPDLYLVLAPRNPGRAGEVGRLAAGLGLRAVLRSRAETDGGDLLLLDSLGELAGLYSLGALAFVGGSLVPERGHNPLEPVLFGKPVLFGPHMEDFAEIAGELLAVGAAEQVNDWREMVFLVASWLADPGLRSAIGRSGAGLIESRRGVADRHLELLGKVLQEKG
ncbi:MAG: 3-deoxy-D-manno-octulosonic acid transferase [Desulfobulbaceae bacterium]|nr:3-deoxy-D-manno-octulosonic acid transferase [Desulfobulbaceae bacterium]